MDFYLADSISTFLTVIIFAAIFVAFFKRGLRETFFYLWTLGWAFTLLHYLAQVVGLVSPVPLNSAFFLDRLLLSFSVIVFFVSAREFTGRRTSRYFLAGLGLLFAVFSYLQIYHPDDGPKFLVAATYAGTLWNVLLLFKANLLNFLLGVTLFLTGMFFAVDRKEKRSIGVLILSYAFLVWGIGFLCLFFLLRLDYYLPMIAQLLNLPKPIVAVGMIIYLFEREKVVVQQHRDQAVEQRDFIQSLMDNANDPVVVTNRDGKFRWVNRECERLLELTQDQLKERNYADFIDPDDRPILKQMSVSVMAGKTQALEIRILTPQEKKRSLQVSMTPLRDVQGSIHGVLTVGRDVTEAKAMEQQLQHAQKLMALGRLISGAAHELNNPLTTVMGFSELSLQDKNLEPKIRQRFERILHAAVRSKSIVEGLQNFVRVPEHVVDSFEINDLVVDSLEELRDELRVGQIETRLRFGSESMKVEVDRERMLRIIHSILKNAAEAIREIRPSGLITITTEKEQGNVVLSVADDGPGVKDPQLLFEPFYTTKDVGKGTGMSLSVGYSILQHYGGKIMAENNLKGGATFRVILPLAAKSLRAMSE